MDVLYLREADGERLFTLETALETAVRVYERARADGVGRMIRMWES